MQQYRKSLYFFLVTFFLYGFSIAAMATTWVIFMIQKGINVFQVGLINIVFMVGIFLFEIPTGVVSDVFGRKKSVVAAFFVRALAMLIIFFMDNLAGCIIGFALAALGETLFSGAGYAWLIDSMAYYRSPDSNDVIFSRIFMISNAATILGGLTGAYVAKGNIALPWLVAAIGFVVCGFYAQFFGKEEYFTRQADVTSLATRYREFKETVARSVSIVLKEKEVFILICISVVVMMVITIPVTYWQPYLLNLKPERVELLGWVNSFMLLASIFGNFVVKRLVSKVQSKQNLLILALLLNAVPIIVAGLMGSFYMVLMFFLLHLFGWGVFGPLNNGLFNDLIPSKERATVLSIRSMMESFGSIIGLLLGGYLAKVYSIGFSWFVMGIILVCTVPLFKMIKGQKR